MQSFVSTAQTWSTISLAYKMMCPQGVCQQQVGLTENDQNDMSDVQPKENQQCWTGEGIERISKISELYYKRRELKFF